ncbi:PREDICTED: RNA-binding protein 25-like [Trachymyrmex cornetzi]|uniref:RNA-binding protein 25-like n=1 Tax=Trachymyrmex cornetzi TaxID=471704 RepID=UPI00084F079C|nr:PREDICTED: RNA-binding protein 25-like [Trachymyrmex cornetzi]
MKGDLRRQIKLGVNVAKIAVQRLVSEIAKGTGPTDEIRANNQALEREVVKLRREVDTLRRERERETMRGQIKALQGTVQDLKDRDRKRGRGRSYVLSSDEEARDSGSPIRTRGRNREERPARNRDTDIDEAESLPPAYRPTIGVRKRLEDRPPRLTTVNERSDIVTEETRQSALRKRGDAHMEGTGNRPMSDNRGAEPRGDRDLGSPLPPMDYPAEGEA